MASLWLLPRAFLYNRKQLLNGFNFIRGYRCAFVSFYTARSFASGNVTSKVRLNNFISNECVAMNDHFWSK